jgi:OPA family glycerol-3-phosphate transporter-like MFS transporter
MTKKQLSPGSLIALCWFVYFASYLTRQNYNAALAPMLEDLGAAKSALSLAGTASFVAYGAGQPISGLLLRRVDARRMIFLGLCASAGCNLLLAGCPSWFPGPRLPLAMTAVWCANGFAQALLWPALVQFMARQFTPADYNRATVHVNIAGSSGTVAVYLLVPLCVALSTWRWVFVIGAAAAVIAALFWRRLAPNEQCTMNNEQLTMEPPKPVPMRRLLAGFGLGPILLAVALQGILRDGVTAWMPVLVTESYPAFSSAKSVLTAAILPLFAVLSLRVTGGIAKKINHELRSAAWFYGAGALAALGLGLCLSRWLPMVNLRLPLSVAFMALLTGCMHGVNLAAVCQLPARFGKYGATGAAAGIINAFVYAGSALSMLGTALLAERFGWQATVWVWFGVALVGTGLFVFFTKRARKVLYQV